MCLASSQTASRADIPTRDLMGEKACEWLGSGCATVEHLAYPVLGRCSRSGDGTDWRLD